MTKDELIRKLDDIEWENFEVKTAANEIPKNVWETVSAFSNTAGGWIIFGVSFNQGKYEIIGIKNPEKIESDFLTVLRGQKFNVPINVLSKKYNFDNKTVLAFYISLSNKKPVYFNNVKNTFIRTGSGDQRATQEEIDTMYRNSSFGTRSVLSIEKSSIAWLNQHSVEQYREYVKRFNSHSKYNLISNEEFFQKLRIVSDGKITYSGLLAFGKEDFVQEIFPDFRIDLLEIPGTSNTDSKTRYTYKIAEQENLWEYYFVLFDRLQQKIDKPFKLGNEGFAIEDYPYLEALREALVNMLMHADYFSTGRSRIRVFYDKIEFLNFGTLPKPLNIIMKEDISMPRNPIITKIFRVAKLAENAGFGFDKMIKGWKAYKNLEPEFYPEFDFVKIVFPLTDSENTLKTVEKTVEKIIIAIKKNPKITQKELMIITGLSRRGVEWNLQKLKEKKRIKREGADKGGLWKIL